MRADLLRRPEARLLAAVGVGAAGWALGLVLAARTPARVGPFDTTLTARPGGSGGTTVQLAPLGAVRFDTHDAPLAVGVRVEQIRADEARRFVADPAAFGGFADDLAADAERGLRRLAVRAVVAGVLAAALAGFVVLHGWRPALVATVTALVLTGTIGAITAATWRAESLAEPRYTGLLTNAPRVIGDARDVADNFARYRAQLARLVGNVAELYQAGAALPAYRADPDTIRLLHVSDLHLNPEGFDLIARLVDQFEVDAVVDTGDLTDFGTTTEARYAERIGSLPVPYVYVKGNHDSAATVTAVTARRNAVVLDGTVRTVAGIRFAGYADPRFTPDKSTRDDADQKKIVRSFAAALPGRLPPPGDVDVLAVHDPAAAADTFGLVPLVLAGHRHRIDAERRDGTLLLVQGSTGGAGLRALEHDEPTPLTAGVLYLDRATRRLEAYDQVVVAGLGGTSVEISRHVVRAADVTPSGPPSPR